MERSSQDRRLGRDKPDTTAWSAVGDSPEFREAYTMLRRIASRYLGSQEPLTLQTTSLVHEAYLKLAARSSVTLRGTNHARALMARAMRQVLIDHIRSREAEKRNPPPIRIALEHLTQHDSPASSTDHEVETVDRALDHLEADDPGSAQLLELVFFGGYSQREIGEIFGISDRAVRARLVKAQESLRRILAEPS